MTTAINDLKNLRIYARVQGRLVVEYPLTAEQIEARGHDVRQYEFVTFMVDNATVGLKDLPGVTVQNTLTVESFGVLCLQSYRMKTLEEVLASFRKQKDGEAWVPFDHAQIPAGEIDYFQKLVGEKIMGVLDTVAKLRYDSLDSLLARYSNSTNPVWKKEAVFMQEKLDEAWHKTLSYFSELRAGTKPLPTAESDLDALMVPPKWTDML